RQQDGAAVAPAAGRGLAGDQAGGQHLDQRAVLDLAEAVEEEEGQGDLVGRVQAGGGLADQRGGLLERRLQRGRPALQQRQAGQGRVADDVLVLRGPGAGGSLRRQQEAGAGVDGPVDAGLGGRRQGRRVGPQEGSGGGQQRQQARA